MASSHRSAAKTKRARARPPNRVAPKPRPHMQSIVRPRLKLARILRTLRAHLPDLTARYPIQSLGVFGSYVRGDATTSSDLDVLIESTPNAHLTLLGVAHLENELSDMLKVKVDLVEKEGVKPRILKNIVRDLVMV